MALIPQSKKRPNESKKIKNGQRGIVTYEDVSLDTSVWAIQSLKSFELAWRLYHGMGSFVEYIIEYPPQNGGN